MDKVIELAKQSGAVSYTNRHYPDRPYRTFGPEELQKFYTIARADYETKLSAVMPADFKDWHENNHSEWPDIAAWVITNLREQRADLEDELSVLRSDVGFLQSNNRGLAKIAKEGITRHRTRMAGLEAENAKLRQALECIAGKRLCLDNLMGNVEIARAALGETE